MSQEKEIKCEACGCTCNPQPLDDAKPVDPVAQDDQGANDDANSMYQEETKLAVLIALVPAMTMTVFNLMGLI